MKAADTLTVPEVPMDRWFICWVRGPIMLAGCMEMVWSMAGVITAPYTHVQTQTHTVTGQTAWRTGEEMSYHSTIHLDDFIRVNGLITQPCSPHTKPSPSFTHLIGPYSRSWALLWGPDVSCSTSTSEIMRSKCESCILLQRWCITHLTAELLHTAGVLTFQACWDESANTCEVQTKEREKSAICNRWPELSSDAVTWPLPKN